MFVVAVAGLAALVPLILFAGFWIRSELGKSQREIELFLGGQAAALSQRVDAEMRQQLAALQAIAALPALDQDRDAFADAARRVARSMRHWSGLSLVDARTGAVVFATASVTPGESLTPSTLAEVRATRRSVIDSRVTATGRTILLGFPVVRDDQADFLLVTAFDGQDVQDIVGEQGRDAKLLFMVVDRAYRVVGRAPALDGTIGREVDPAFRAMVGQASQGSTRGVVPEGEETWTAFTRSDLTGWVASASLGSREIERLSAGSLRATVAAGALSLVLAGILAVFIIHHVMERRVAEERVSASRALGELDARLLATTQEALDEQRKAASEREVLLREIYHRVKNNLQIVQSLLRLGSRDLKPEQREPFESAVRRIGAMARVHTLLYNSPDLASIDFKDYLDELLKELSDGFAAEERSIEAVLDANPMRMPLDTAVPLAFIAVEILTNSFKHAFPEGRSGRITVEVQRNDGDAILRIQDDGVGLSPEAPFKRRLGLTIVRNLVQQIGGTLEEPVPGSSTFLIRFPIKEAPSATKLPRPQVIANRPVA